ncbi:MAG: histidine kinase [Bdellovibrio sp. ArHS]|uniref:sensor histidine kinase n=1 Tax=Bdellovibrio sp. ArHS TaxID=1569284 RepID=UPI000582B36A|nr:sensor histidine kinase [Bdellovibrio sp. ArHS]KHD87387.1 MAG: histidine kinase [Bdellovibrio sp. ArHS]
MQLSTGVSSPQATNPSEVIFADQSAPDLAMGYSAEDLWIRVTLFNDSDSVEKKILYLDSPLAGRLSLYGADGIEQISGPGVPLQDRLYHSRLGAFPLELKPRSEEVLYLKRDSHHALSGRVVIEDESTFLKNEMTAKAIFFFYIGGILSLVIYNFFVGLSTSQKDHLSYAVFAFSFGVTAMVLHGVFDTYLFPQGHFVFSNYLMFFSSLTLLSATLFVRRFLNIGRSFWVGYYGTILFCGLALVTVFVSFFAPKHRELFVFGYWIDLSIAGAILFFIFCGFYSLIKLKNRLALYFLASWLVVLVGTFFWIASLHGLVRSTSFTQYSLLFANLGEMLVLSLGLAYKLKTLDREKRLAQQAAGDKERYHRLVRVLSHDVANTVSGLMYHSEMLEELAQEPQIREHARKIGLSIQRLDKILHAVRNEEVVYSLKSKSPLQTVDLGAACDEAIQHCSWQLENKNIQIIIDVPPGKVVKADPSALVNQVLLNLLSNAIKFSQPGQCITIDYIEKPEHLGLRVKDQGVGIPAEDLEYIFKGKKLFSRRGTANESGTGLGTTLVSDYMHLFGGVIEVESTQSLRGEGSGTTVILLFPKRPSAT